MRDPNPFTEKVQELLKAAVEAGFHRDDFYAHCRRLEGFGLAIEVPKQLGTQVAWDLAINAFALLVRASSFWGAGERKSRIGRCLLRLGDVSVYQSSSVSPPRADRALSPLSRWSWRTA